VPVERALLLIADVGGYTRFMRLHRMSLAHSQDIVGRLLDAMIDAAPPLQLVGLEGDAAFLYLPHAPDDEAAAAQRARAVILAMHRAFHSRQQWMVARNMCSCDACRQAGELKVKFVAHVGEVASQTVRDRVEVVGIDVIEAHRMLKNPVPVAEYVLMSSSLYEQADWAKRERATEIELELEGIGPATTYFVDLGAIAPELPPPERAGLPSRLRETMGVIARGLPAMAGAKKRSTDEP